MGVNSSRLSKLCLACEWVDPLYYQLSCLFDMQILAFPFRMQGNTFSSSRLDILKDKLDRTYESISSRLDLPFCKNIEDNLAISQVVSWNYHSKPKMLLNYWTFWLETEPSPAQSRCCQCTTRCRSIQQWACFASYFLISIIVYIAAQKSDQSQPWRVIVK